jgi:hypothetical protein
MKPRNLGDVTIIMMRIQVYYRGMKVIDFTDINSPIYGGGVSLDMWTEPSAPYIMSVSNFSVTPFP